MVCKYFLPFGKVPFHFVDGFFCCTEDFYFDVVPLVYFCFFAYVFGVISKKSLPNQCQGAFPLWLFCCCCFGHTAWLHCIWDLISLTSDWTLHWKCGVLTTGPPGKSPLCFFSSHFTVSGLTFMSLIHLELIFVNGVKCGSSFIALHSVIQFSQHDWKT